MNTKSDKNEVNKASNATRLRRRVFAFFAFLLAVFVLGIVWFQSQDRKPVVLTVATGTFGSDADILLREVADVVERHSDTLRLRVRASKDASQNIALLNARKSDLAVIRADTPVVADIRVIADLYPDVMQIITRGNSGAYTVNDLAKVSVSIPEYGTDGFRSFWVVGDHYDLPIDKMKWKAESFESAAAKLLNGQTDAIFTMRSLRDQRLIRLFEDAQLKRLPMRFIPVRQAEAIAIKRPFLQPASIPSGAFTGATPVPSTDVPSAAVERILVTREDIDSEAIGELTRILFEHRLDLTIRFSLASAIRQPDQSRGLSVPLHEGAQAFYDRDQPSFIQENAEPIALLVTVLTIMVSGGLALRSRFMSSQKNSADSYNYQLLDIQKKALLEDDLQELAGLKIDLNDVLGAVVVALDTDEVTEEGFQSFSILLQAVRETINDRMQDIRQS